ncbi:MAG: helicase-related protein [Rhodospirillaceae bacterium]|nr:helicase-related protein [Rhodospirillaceae bacterium]
MRSHVVAPSSVVTNSVQRIIAILGPTNTGKTHFAMERMLAHRSGMIGFPLRLLARENYDRAIRAAGSHAVALVTGEEKIIPPAARYFLCTAEAMPTDREVEFVAIDEVQLAADPERGYIFTDRMLHARGTRETMLIGAETVRPILKRLVPDVEITTRPRFSRLAYAGPKKITRLPPRTATVAFSASEVYALAEVIRRKRGGAALVLGALSPRTRNAQIEMFQAGEVDYLVATDAIGMGLNMDVNHIAFTELTKFDGRMRRRLTPAEVGQIAGRAGRHMQDGTFGTTANAPEFDSELIRAIETHTFDLLPFVFWRNRKLDFASVDSLIQSLALPPQSRDLVPAREAEDYRTLAVLAGQQGIRARLNEPAAVALLWECCQIPDFRKVMSEAHNSLVSRIFTDLTGDGARIAPAWIERQVARIDKTTGDIGALVGRIADIRTWTYVSYRSDWLDEPLRWQEQTRRIEDRLSDALHERLTERFVDKRSAVLVKRLRDKRDLQVAILASGDLVVEGITIGTLNGFRFAPAPVKRGGDAWALRNAGWRALRPAIEERLAMLDGAKPKAIKLSPEGDLRWRGAVIGRLAKGQHLLTPGVRPLIGEGLDSTVRDRVAAKLDAWLVAYLPFRLGSIAGSGPEGLSGPARALMYQLGEAGGHLPRGKVRSLIDALSKPDRKALRAAGLRIGAQRIYYPELLLPQAQALLGLLWQVLHGQREIDLPAFGPAFPIVDEWPRELLHTCGYVIANDTAVRADRLEGLWMAVRKLPRGTTVIANPELAEAAGLEEGHLPAGLHALGYRPDPISAGTYAKAARRRKKYKANRMKPDQHSPFAILRELTMSR